MMNHQAVSAGHEETLAAAKEVLLEGGNAFDAAIASYFTMFITEPCMASAGAGGFALCYSAEKRTVSMLDFFAQTPGAKPELKKRDFFPIDVDFGNEIETFHVGLASAAVPGAVAGIYEMHRRFGTMPISELIQPAMRLAKEGVILNTFQAYDLDLLKSIFRIDRDMKLVFFNGEELKKEGDLLYFPQFADFLEFIKSEGDTGFYRGEIGKVIDLDSKVRGGYLRRSDFENYKAIWRNPLKISGNNYQVNLPNSPSLGGGIMSILLAYQKEFSGDWVRSMSELKKNYIQPEQIQSGVQRFYPGLDYDLESRTSSTKGTSHFNVADKFGNAVSLTTSIGEGSGYFIPGTDMQLNNMLGEDFLLPNGFHSWEPDVRLNSMMTPTIVLDKEGRFKYAGGSGGAGRIPYMIAQVLGNLFDKKMSLKAATEQGRIHVQSGVLHFEPGAEVNHSGRLKINAWDAPSLFFGGVHSIFSSKEGVLEAMGDARRYGVGEVF